MKWNEIEMKRNEIEMKWNETKQNEMEWEGNCWECAGGRKATLVLQVPGTDYELSHGFDITTFDVKKGLGQDLLGQ